MTYFFLDFNSLYPSVCWSCEFPIGVPEIISYNFQGLENYWGLIKAAVLAPNNMLIPILPYRTEDKRLVFSSCRTCSEQASNKSCMHKEEERAFIGVWFSEELKIAVAKTIEFFTFVKYGTSKRTRDQTHYFVAIYEIFLKSNFYQPQYHPISK